MSDLSDNIFKVIPKDRYIKIVYLLMVASSAIGLLLSVLGLAGIYLGIAGLLSLIGLAGLVLVLLAFFAFKNEFPPLDQAHLLYLAILFAALFVVGMILGQAIAGMDIIGSIVMLLYNIIGLVLLFTGFNSWSHGREITKDNLASEVQLAVKRA